MFQSLVSYSIIITLMLFFTKVNIVYLNGKKDFINKSFWSTEILIILLLFTIFFGIRYDVGKDYINYLTSYLNGSYVNGKYEPLFFLITDICYGFDIHPTIYFSIFCFIQIFFFFYSFKNERYLYPLLVVFLFFNGEFLTWMNIIRQSLAMCVWLYSINFINEKKLFHYFAFGVIACLFHRSAIVLFVFYPLLKNEKDYFKSISLQLFLFFLTFIIKNAFEELILHIEPIIIQFQSIIGGEKNVYGSYNLERMLDEFNTESRGTGLAYLFKIIVWVMIIFYSKKLKSFYNNRKFNICYFFFFISLLFFYVLPEGTISLSRPFRYLYIFQTIMLSYFIFYLLRCNSYRYNKVLAYILIIAFCGIFILNQVTAPTDNYVWYKTYFEQQNE